MSEITDRDYADIRWLTEQVQWKRTYQRLLEEKLQIKVQQFMWGSLSDQELGYLRERCGELKEIMELPKNIIEGYEPEGKK